MWEKLRKSRGIRNYRVHRGSGVFFLFFPSKFMFNVCATITYGYDRPDPEYLDEGE